MIVFLRISTVARHPARPSDRGPARPAPPRASRAPRASASARPERKAPSQPRLDASPGHWYIAPLCASALLILKLPGGGEW